MRSDLGVRVTISRAAAAAIRAHVAETPEIEVCGLLFGDASVIDEAMPTRNVSKQPNTRFEIDPQALFSAIRDERAGGRRLIGCYHSHPNGECQPSEHDKAMAHDAGRLWVIATNDQVACWRVAKPNRLIPVELALASDHGQRQ